jgi:hypothetical protein
MPESPATKGLHQPGISMREASRRVAQTTRYSTTGTESGTLNTMTRDLPYPYHPISVAKFS